jgi:hypothetical protein
VNQVSSPFDGYNKALYDESRRYVRKPRTLVVDAFLKVFPFPKIDQNLEQCETFNNVCCEVTHLALYVALEECM